MRSQSISSMLLTICLLNIARWHLQFAANWRTRHISVTDRLTMPNYEASIAFASLALVIIGLIVIWTGYQKRRRSAWFIMAVFVFVYFVPVNLIDVFLDIRNVGWSWWPAVVHDAREGRAFSLGAIYALASFAVMVIALLIPIRTFFGKSKAGHDADMP